MAEARSGGLGWTGFVGIAGILMVMVGAFDVFMGFVALFQEEFFLVPESRLLLLDYASWGAVHLIFGLVLAATGIGVIFGQTWALVVGVVIAAINAITQVAFLSAYPLLSIIVIILDVAIIYALAVHGKELAALEEIDTSVSDEIKRTRRAG